MNTVASDQLDHFGAVLMRARTLALASLETATTNRYTLDEYAGLEDAALDNQAAVLATGAVAIDSFLVSFLSDVDWMEHLDITWHGEALSALSDGLPGELFGSEGWIEKFTPKEGIQ